MSTQHDAFVFTKRVINELQVTDRGLRKMIAAGRFPKPSGNLSGRNFWLESAYSAWRAEVLAGKYKIINNLSISHSPQPAAVGG